MKSFKTHLNELSKKTLGSYASKAVDQGDMAARMYKVSGDNKKGSVNQGMAKIANKRRDGVKNAINKLSGRARVNAKESVDQLDELSKKTLGSYAKKATASKDKASDKQGYHSMKSDDHYDKEMNHRSSNDYKADKHAYKSDKHAAKAEKAGRTVDKRSIGLALAKKRS